MSEQENAIASQELFAGDGEMGELMRSLDWSQTALGPVSQWPQSLKTVVSIILHSRYPMFVWWGAEYINLYNDAYRPILGASKHPKFLGKSAKDCWAEIWNVIGLLADSVVTTGQATWSDNLLLMMDRYGYIEETYFTFSYSPVLDESGKIGGVFCAVAETTEQIIDERRLRSLRELATNTAEAKTVAEACEIATQTLSTNSYDIPFALLYLVTSDHQQAYLAGSVGIEADTPAIPQQVDLTQQTDSWHLTEVSRNKTAVLINDLTTHFGKLPGGAWPESPNSALVMPIAKSGQKQQLAGLLVMGISPRREFDDDYRGFFDLVASNVATAIANADAYAAERRRAEALAELDQAKTTFFTNISHEFRTPLTLILGPLEEVLTEVELLPPPKQQQLETVHRNSLRLLKLVNTLLDFSRIEAGRIQATYEPTDLALLTADLVSVFRSAIEKAGMRLLVDCPPLPEPVYVDRQMWEKIVLNLLSNAFKFTFAGEIAVSLHWTGKHIDFTVRDTGIGIPAEELPRLFERFHRIPGARGRTYEGSGIGLSLVKELVKLHGGTIQVTSQVDQGSCFTVSIPTGYAHLPNISAPPIKTPLALDSTAIGTAPYVQEALRWLPLDEAGELLSRGDGAMGRWGAGELLSRGAGEAENNNSQFPIPNSQSPITNAQSPMPNPQFPIPNPQSPIPYAPCPMPKILVVDDNADMRDYLQRLLCQRYEVEAVADGEAALAAIQKQLPSLVIADVMMPRLDGFQLLRQLRANRQTQDLPIILLSARAGEESRIQGLEAGADNYLIKPFSARELLAHVDASLKIAQWRQAAAHWQQQLRTQAESAKHQISEILESITDGFIAFDSEWRFTYLNHEAASTLGKSTEELLGKNVWQEIPELEGTSFGQLYRQAVATGVVQQLEDYYAPFNAWFAVRAYPSATGLTVYFQNISDRKLVEAERAELLAREQQANRVKDEFLAVLSHELRSPLNPILGWSKLLQTHKFDQAKTNEALATIERNAKLQAELIADLLDVSRILQGKISLNVSPVNLASTIQAAMETVRLAALAKSIEIQTIFDPNVGQIVGDSNRLQQVFWNLLSNAVKFTPTGGRIEIRLSLSSPHTPLPTPNSPLPTPHFALIQVTDTGKGIDPDFLPYVFDYFRQADAATTRKFGGLGLGMAIARYLVELHGGTIQAESAGEGKGATFTVSLPLMPMQPQKEDIISQPEQLQDLNNIKILVVEDDTDTRELIAFLLEQYGASVTAVTSASEALAAFKKQLPDVLLSDIGLPEVDGYTLIKQVTSLALEQGGQIPAIALTAYAGELNQQQALAAGFQRHVTKPVEPGELIAAIADLIKHSKGQTQL